MAKNGVEGVYTADPRDDPDASSSTRSRHMEAVQRRLRVMDLTALTLCMENNLPIHVFNMDDERNIDRIVCGRAGRDPGRDDDMSEIIDELIADAGERMEKSVESTRHEFGTVRTGRASAGLLDRILVDYYGAPTPLKQMATISAPEARLLTVQPYDKTSIKAIEKAIMESDVGLTPNNDGKLIRLGIPELNEERRKELVRVVRHIAEEGRVAIRNIRRDVHARPARAQGRGRGRRRRRAARRGRSCRSSPTPRSHELDESLKAKEAEILEV